MNNESLRVGLVGLGKMGIVHSCVLKVLPNVQLTALCEKSRITRRFLKKMFNEIPITDNVERLADFDLDAVFVTTPIPSHFLVAKTIYLKKIAQNLFIEKTLARSYEEAKELCNLADSYGGVNMVGYLRRFYVTFRKAKDLLSRSAIGETSSFAAYALSSDFSGINQAATTPMSRGGVLRDLGCHAVDLALWFFGELQVESAKPRALVSGEPEDSVGFQVKNSKGLEGEFNVSWRAQQYRLPEIGFSITGSEGKIFVNDDKLILEPKIGSTRTWFRHDLEDNVLFWLGLPEYHREDLHFVKSIAEGLCAESNFHAASKVDEIITEVEDSVEGN